MFFVGAYRPEVFGIARFVPQYVDTLADAGWSIDVFAPYPLYPAWKLDRRIPKVSNERDGSVRVTRYAPFVSRRYSPLTRGLHEASIALNAVRLLRSRVGTANLVVVTSPPALASACALWIAHRAGKPCMVLAYDLLTDLAFDAFGLAGRVPALLLRVVESRLHNRADTVVALTDDMASRIRQLASRSAPLPVIRIWADDELRHLDHAAAAKAFRERLGIPEDRRLVGFGGSFGRKQHLPRVVQAVRELPRSFTTIFVGDGPARSEMERLAAEGPGDVRILPPLPSAELYAFLAACDVSIVIAWTRHAGSLFPSKVANVLAAGSPILAITDQGTELAALLEREDIGFTCPSLEPEQIREAAHGAAELGRDTARRGRCSRYAAMHLDRGRAMARFVEEVNRLAG